MKMIQIGIVDDHAIFRKTLVEALSSLCGSYLELVLEARDGIDLLNQLKDKRPQIILMDISMPNMGGIEATLRVRDLYPHIRVIVYTEFDLEDNIIEMHKLGVKSFLDKQQSIDEVVKAIQIVSEGGFYFPEPVAKIWENYIKQLHKQQGNIKLDKKELQLLKMICEGKSSIEIGNTLNKSPRTIEEHSANLRRKFNVANKEQLIVLAAKNNFIW
ncbi:MAG: response regulator transcription factor [Cyclobacteriaceae bacterium]|nr:response regulator transcription factor [Cyclobacteriaceae bacterium]